MSKGYLYDNGDELITREEALPDASEASQGDVLSLNASKEPVWSAPSGGEGVPFYDIILTMGEELGQFNSTVSYNDVVSAVSDGKIPRIIFLVADEEHGIGVICEVAKGGGYDVPSESYLVSFENYNGSNASASGNLLFTMR